MSANDVIDHYRRGDTVVLQGLHHTNPHLAKLANNVALAVDHPVQVNAYLSPADARGLDLHFDFHDVFVVQLGGSKRWRIWAPLERTTNPVKGRCSVPALRSEELGEPCWSSPWAPAIASTTHHEPSFCGASSPKAC